MKMGLKWIFKKDYIIGLDIGSSSVKIAQFAETEGGLCLVRAELKEIGSSADNEALDKEIVSAIIFLFRGIDIRKSTVIVSINCPQTAIKMAAAPYMPKPELREGIELESKNYFPFSTENAFLDVEVIKDVFDKGARKYEVIVATCPVTTVSRYLALLGKAGIRPAYFVPASYAMQKAAALSNRASDKAAAFIDIGERNTEFIILKGTDPVFSRKVPITGSDFTKAMTGALVSDRGRTQLTMEEAEKIKREVGIPPETESGIIDGKISAGQVLSMLRMPLEQLVSEIGRCLDYYREETGSGRVDSMVLSGGGASLGGLVKFLSGELGVEASIDDPLNGLKMEKGAVRERDKAAHRLTLAIGAALAGAKGINLLPPEMKEETKRMVKRGTLEVVGAAIVVIAALFFIGMKIQVGNFEKRIAVARLELSSLRLQLKKAEAEALADKVLADEPQWEDVFTEFSNLLPENIHMTNLKMENNIIFVKGVVASEDGEQALADFILTLEKGLFSNVKLVSTKDLGEKPGIEFELKCWVDYE
ncbi:MAG: type IV pilus assembly protein PilM [Candidatus Omnitrophota bacterium]|nr:type IV pilus assembly protein PilM [Candidatus Omnitrophota bacterium]